MVSFIDALGDVAGGVTESRQRNAELNLKRDETALRQAELDARKLQASRDMFREGMKEVLAEARAARAQMTGPLTAAQQDLFVQYGQQFAESYELAGFGSKKEGFSRFLTSISAVAGPEQRGVAAGTESGVARVAEQAITGGEPAELEFRSGTDAQGNPTIIGLDKTTGKPVSEIAAGVRGVTANEFGLAVQVLAATGEVPEFAPQPIRDWVSENNITQQTAATLVEMSRSGGMRIRVTDDGVEVTTGAAATRDPVAEQLAEVDTERALAAEDLAPQIANTSRVLRDLEEVGTDATGFRGIINEKLGGVVGQFFPGFNIAEITGEGASPERQAAFREDARTIIAQAISQITGEESGRFTEAERLLTDAALRLTVPGASQDQIRGALRQLLVGQVVLQDGFLALSGKAPVLLPDFTADDLVGDLPPEKQEALGKFRDQMVRNGLGPDQIVAVFEAMLRQREQIGQVRKSTRGG